MMQAIQQVVTDNSDADVAVSPILLLMLTLTMIILGLASAHHVVCKMDLRLEDSVRVVH